MKRLFRRLPSILGIVVLLVGLPGWAPARPVGGAALAAPLAAPASVTIAGSLQSEAGCAGDWDPACAATHLGYDSADDVWQGTWTLPSGGYEYKAALNDGWDESYGLNADVKGANIPLNLAADGLVKFYYDDKTHWVTDNQNSVIVTAAGSFQSELGCPGDWQPDCLRSWLQDPSGSGIYHFETNALPAGNYEAKAAIKEGWDENYGQGGVAYGDNIPFSVAADGAKVVFQYDPTTHILSILSGHSLDNNVEWEGLRHDSRDPLYRTPGGAVPAGTPVKIRLRTFHNDVNNVKLRAYDVDTSAQRLVTMDLAASDVSCYQVGLEGETCDFWQATLANPQPANVWYRFIITDGTKTAYYADNTPALDGGLGAPSDSPVDNSFALMVYNPTFRAPAWAKSAVVYQIFPDRFRNGNPKNDPKTGDARYDDPVLKLPWGTLPEGYCRNYVDGDVNCPWRFDTTPPVDSPTKEQPRGRDYFGGDLKGVIDKLGYLKDLGVTEIYFNPIFDAQSNHGYDTANYRLVDPNLGTVFDFLYLAAAARQRGIRLVLDGVFNHMSSDSAFFDRYHRYPDKGACESSRSFFRSWFTFVTPSDSDPSPCVPSTPNGTDRFYSGWFGFDSIPVLNKTNPDVQQYFVSGPASISRQWLVLGAQGWRLDVMGDASFPAGYWESFRQVVKKQNPDAVIIGELWQKDSTLLRFLRGDRADSTMNYRLRDAVVGLLAPGPFDSKGFADSGRTLLPSEFAARMLSIREDYPDAAYYSSMNLLDSHDTERLLWTLTPGQATTADKEQNPANLSQGKLRVQLASLVQFTVPGAPTIYYGDEVGMTGADDPDDRRTYPWTDTGGSPDTAMLAHYKALAQARKASPVLVNGDLRVLLADDAQNTVAYGRKTADGAALVALNLNSTAQTLTIPMNGYLPDGLALQGKLAVGMSATASATVTDGVITLTLDPMSGLLLVNNQAKLATPPAPANLRVTEEGNAQVTLAWNAVNGAVGYNVYRSPLSGGGYEKVNAALLTATTFADTGLRNAATVYYTVRAVNAAGVESTPSNEVGALPHLSIGWANTQWPPDITHEISVTNPTPYVYGQVWIDGVTNQPGQTPSLHAQLGYGPQGTNPAVAPAWVWVDADFNTDAGNNDEFKAQLLPDTVGVYDYLYRYTTTDGRDWLYADLNGPLAPNALPVKPGKLTVSASADTTPPPAPDGLAVTMSAPGQIDLAWNAVTGDPTLYGYEVLRGTVAGGPYTFVARVTGTSYSDISVAEGGLYFYVVRAVDGAFNRSGNSNEVSATAEPRTVQLVLSVTVPDSTDATGRNVYIAGTLDRLDGGLPSWNANGTVLTRVDATHWTITLTGKEGTQIEYKYTLGDWEHVEKDNACGEISNRALTLAFGGNGTQTANDIILNWRNVAPCGN